MEELCGQRIDDQLQIELDIAELGRLLKESNLNEITMYMTESMMVEFDKAVRKEAEKYLNNIK